MITLFHGEDTKAARDAFLFEETKFANAKVFAGEILTLTDLVQELEGGGLFDDENVVFIENLLSKRKPSKELEGIISFLNQNESKIFLLESKELTKKQQLSFPKAVVKIFKLPQTLFAFLDSIKPNSRQAVIAFHDALQSTEPELLLFMMVRQLRLLLALQNEIDDSIDEIKRIAPWQKSKLLKQASQFSHEQLLSFYKKLYVIDLSQKTGQLHTTLAQAIDFLLIADL